MSLLDYAVLGVIMAAVVYAAIRMFRRKKLCGGACGCCPHKNSCDTQPNKQN